MTKPSEFKSPTRCEDCSTASVSTYHTAECPRPKDRIVPIHSISPRGFIPSGCTRKQYAERLATGLPLMTPREIHLRKKEW